MCFTRRLSTCRAGNGLRTRLGCRNGQLGRLVQVGHGLCPARIAEDAEEVAPGKCGALTQ